MKVPQPISLPVAAVFVLLGTTLLLEIPLLFNVLTTIIGISLVFCGLFIASKLIPRSRINSCGKAVFISGCDTGFGHLLAVKLDKLEYRVFAGCLFPGMSGHNLVIFFVEYWNLLTCSLQVRRPRGSKACNYVIILILDHVFPDIHAANVYML